MAKEFGVSESGLHRHFEAHLGLSLMKIAGENSLLQAQHVRGILEYLVSKALQQAALAEAKGDAKLHLAWHRRTQEAIVAVGDLFGLFGNSGTHTYNIDARTQQVNALSSEHLKSIVEAAEKLAQEARNEPKQASLNA